MIGEREVIEVGVLSRILGNFVPGHQLVYKVGEQEKVYTFSHISDDHQTRISREYYKHQRAKIKQYFDDGEFDNQEYQRLLAELRQQDMAGKFELSDPEGMQMMRSKDGQLITLTVLLDIPLAEARDLLRLRNVEVQELLVAVYFESFPDRKPIALAKEAEEEAKGVMSEAAKKK